MLSGDGDCFFDVEAIERRMAELEPAFEVRRGGALQVWYRAAAGREYWLRWTRPGGGEDGDFAAVQVVDRETGLQCAELQERLRPAELAKVAVELAKSMARQTGCRGAEQPWSGGAGVSGDERTV